jgi:hypothetical protein
LTVPIKGETRMELIPTYFMRVSQLHKNIQMHQQNPMSVMKQLAERAGQDIDPMKMQEFIYHNHKASITQYKELENTHVFNFESQELIDLLLKTDNKIFNRDLPFDNMYFECTIKIKDVEFYGFHIIKDRWGVLIKVYFKPQDAPAPMNAIVPLIDHFAYDKADFGEYGRKVRSEVDGTMKHYNKEVATFVCNCIDFLNTPDVKFVRVDRTPEENEKRVLKGKLPIPTISYIRIDGELKKYLNSISQSRHSAYQYSFWVRGHFRTLKSQRYKEVGKKMWIKPFIKGKGILIKKNYDVDVSTKELNKSNKKK